MLKEIGPKGKTQFLNNSPQSQKTQQLFNFDPKALNEGTKIAAEMIKVFVKDGLPLMAIAFQRTHNILKDSAKVKD